MLAESAVRLSINCGAASSAGKPFQGFVHVKEPLGFPAVHIPNTHHERHYILLFPRPNDTDAEVGIQPQQRVEIHTAEAVVVEIGEVSEPNVKQYLLGSHLPCSRYSGSQRRLAVFKQRYAFSDNNHYIAPNFDMKFRWYQVASQAQAVHYLCRRGIHLRREPRRSVSDLGPIPDNKGAKRKEIVQDALDAQPAKRTTRQQIAFFIFPLSD